MWILKSGDLFDSRYRILREIGSGGMSHVFSAIDEELAETVAIKVIKPEFVEDEEFVTRFKREVRIARQIRHPNVIQVYEFGAAAVAGKRLYYLTMELLKGKTLRVWMSGRDRVPLSDTLRIGLQLCDALGEAHRAGVVHRDIKPQNISVDDDGQIKLMDFGICRMTSLPTLTQGGKLIGTPRYMSPEQIHHRTEPDPRSDLYAVGIVLYELCAKRAPFEGDNAIEIAMRQIEEKPRHPRELNPRVPVVLDRVIMTCLEKNPKDRYQSARELRAALQGIPAQEEMAHRIDASETRSYDTLPTAVSPPLGPTAPAEADRHRGHTTARKLAKKDARRISPVLMSAVSLLGIAMLLVLAVVIYRWLDQGRPQPVVIDRGGVPGSADTGIEPVAVEPEPGGTEGAREAAPPPPENATTDHVSPPPAEVAARTSDKPKPAVLKGQLHITSVPAGAAITIDGRTVGTTPWQGELEVGTYRLQASLPAHVPAEESVTLRAGQSLHRDLHLTPRVRTSAPVRISANPGTEVYVDGRLAGSVPPVVELTLETGHHSIRYLVPDYDEFEEQVDVVPGKTNEFAHRFPLFGGLRIVAQPYARVFLDGKDLGFTPIHVDKVSEGSHLVRLEREGFRPIEQSITVEPGRINRFQFNLVAQDL